jgi:hypothetical protein
MMITLEFLTALSSPHNSIRQSAEDAIQSLAPHDRCRALVNALLEQQHPLLIILLRRNVLQITSVEFLKELFHLLMALPTIETSCVVVEICAALQVLDAPSSRHCTQQVLAAFGPLVRNV